MVSAFVRAEKSIVLTAIEAFSMLLTQEGKVSSQKNLFDMILEKKGIKNVINTYVERRFGATSK